MYERHVTVGCFLRGYHFNPASVLKAHGREYLLRQCSRAGHEADLGTMKP
jgi:hypothetical protein